MGPNEMLLGSKMGGGSKRHDRYGIEAFMGALTEASKRLGAN